MEQNMEDAIRTIGETLLADPSADISQLIENTSRKFDLSPLQAEFLVQKYLLS